MRHTLIRSPLILGVVLAVAALTSPVWAQTEALESSAIQIDPFEPMPFQARALLNVAEPDVLDHLQISTGVFSHRAADLLVLSTDDDVLARAVGQQQRVEVLAAMGFFGFMDVGVAVPTIVDQTSDDLGFIGRNDGQLSGVAFGDVRASARLRLINPRRGTGLGLAIMGTTWFPSGDTTAFNSDGEARWEVRVATGWYHRSGLGFTVNAARQARPHRELHNYVSGDTLRWDVGLRVPSAVEPLTFMATLSGSALADPDGDLFDTRGQGAERPVELLGAAQLRLPGDFYLTGGGGRGMSRGVGAPSWRAFLALHYSGARGRAVRRSRTLVESEKAAEETAEGEESQRETVAEVAAPDPGPDTPDFVIEPPEGEDGFNVLDDVAVVGAEPETRFPTVSVDDEQGLVVPDEKHSEPVDAGETTPDPVRVAAVVVDDDSDFDGIPDRIDRCPDKPEDIDGFQDTDGCPDDDHDGDGITDSADPCPEEAEDVDGYKDDDGCPDWDNDGEGIPDKDDKCPDEAETINGYQDDDGCPDVAPRIQITTTHIVVDGDIEFVSGEAEIASKSRELLNEVARVINANPSIEKILIEGYTDSSGSYDRNLELSARRADAVWDYLVLQGVKPTRLETAGYGELYPSRKNDSRSGRAANRRVEFRILKTKGMSRK